MEDKQPLKADKDTERLIGEVGGEEWDQDHEDQKAKAASPKSGGGGGGGGGGGWGGWGFSPFSVLSDLQKAAEEISRNASAVAQTAAKSFAELQNPIEDSDLSDDDKVDVSASEKELENADSDNLRKSALEKLEKASEDSILGQGLKVLDSSVENLASGAWQALGSAWRGSTDLVHKLENSAINLADTIQHKGLPAAAGSVAPSLLETGKAFKTKGMQVLELVGKETMDLLITETGIELEKNSRKSDHADEDQLYEEVTFDRCFYIYGGPEQLEELEALSNHYTLLFNRRKGKLSQDLKSLYDGKLKEIQQIFSLTSDLDESHVESDKGKKVESGTEGNGDELKSLHHSSINKAADMAAGFTNALDGLTVSEILQRTTGRLESLHSEGVHRLSEMCCSAVSQLLMIGNSIISNANQAKDKDTGENVIDINWPEDSIEKAKVIRSKAQSMTVYVDAVSNSFVTGISDVTEAYQAALKSAITDSPEGLPQASVEEKANSFSENLRADRSTAVYKIQDGLQYLSYLVLTTSLPSSL